MHDHLGGLITDLKILIDKVFKKKSLQVNQITKIKNLVQNVNSSFKEKIIHIMDFTGFSEDFLGNLHAIILRRYVNAERRVTFDYCEEVNKILTSGNLFYIQNNLYLVIQEIVTNDLKYGTGLSAWKISRHKGDIRISLNSRTKALKKQDGAGFGKWSVRNKLLKINGKINQRTINGEFRTILTLPC